MLLKSTPVSHVCVRGEAWGPSPTGNWDDYQVDANGDGDLDQEL